MRVAGALCVVFGLAVATLLLLLPTQLHVLGSTADCGLPIVEAFKPRQYYLDGSSSDQATADQTDQCISQSKDRALAGGGAGLVLVVGGLVMLAAGAEHQSAV